MTSYKRIALGLLMVFAVLALVLGASACGGKKADSPSADGAGATDSSEAAPPDAGAPAPQALPQSQLPARDPNETPRERRERRRER